MSGLGFVFFIIERSLKLKLGGASIPPDPKETRVSACEPQVALNEDACIDASGDEASMMSVCVRQPMLKSSSEKTVFVCVEFAEFSP